MSWMDAWFYEVGQTASMPEEMAKIIGEVAYRSSEWQALERKWAARGNEIIHCANCDKSQPRRQTTTLDLPGRWKYEPICAACIPVVKARYEATCPLCGKQFQSDRDRSGYLSHLELCPDCYTPGKRRELLRVNNQNKRTAALGLPSTLTLGEWLDILVKHEGYCAYCGDQRWEAMDHMTPVCQGGGTTADNCVPVCRRCNSRKGSTGLVAMERLIDAV